MATDYGELLKRYQDMTPAELSEMLERRGIKPIGGGDGTDDNEDNEDDDEGDDDGDDPEKNGKKKSSEKKFSQAEVDATIARRLAREKRNLTTSLTASITEQVKADIETAAAEKKGDLQKIVDDLKPKAARLTEAEKLLVTFEELANARFDQALEQLPDSIKAFAPDEDAPAIEKERWLILKAAPALKAIKGKTSKKKEADDEEDDESDTSQATQRKIRGNSPFDPDPTGKSNKKTVEEIIKGYQSAGSYRPLL